MENTDVLAAQRTNEAAPSDEEAIDLSHPSRISGAVLTVEFHGLSRSVQERFAACIAGRQQPAPILAAKLHSPAPWVWSTVIAAGAAGLLLLFFRGFGDVFSAHALHGQRTLPVYAAFFAAIVLGAVQLWVHRIHWTSLPFRRGVYVFPVSLIDARDAKIDVRSLADVSVIDRVGNKVRIVFGTGEVFTFRADASFDVSRLEKAREEARALRAATEPRTTWLFGIDPLQRPRVSGLLGPRGSLARRIPMWAQRIWAFAPALGLLFAPPLRYAHDLSSDRKMYAHVLSRNDVASYRAYLAQGGRHRDHVASVLLPRAELAEAERAGTVEAIDRYIATHPGSAIAGEVQAARRRALLAELDKAKKIGTVPALQAFAKKWPDHGLEPELRAAIHGLFVPALEAYRSKPPTNPQAAAFVERLFAWSEAKAHAGTAATTIQIRFRRKPSTSMRRADRMVSEHHWFIGEASYPSRYFDTAHAIPREKALGEGLGKRMKDAFGASVFTVDVGPRLEDGQETLPQITEPTLFVTHTTEWRNKFDGSITKPRGVWVATTHLFEATFVIPGDAQPLHFELEVSEPIPEKVIKDHPEGGTPAAPLEELIYGTMATNAFTKFQEKYLQNFLPKQTS